MQSDLSGLALPASSKASASTEAPTKVDPSGNTLTIVVDRGLGASYYSVPIY